MPKMITIPRIIVAGLKGGSGKTTLSVGLLAAFRGEGIKVTPFKKGPDYIDAGWLSSAAGAPCYNLDPFLIGEDRILPSFVEHSQGSEMAVIEGNRGLFDGMDAGGSMSTSKVARMLRCPVILIVDCTKATRTIAALIKGAHEFEKGVRIGGVVLNNIAGKRHEAVIRESIEKYTGVSVIGAIPRLSGAQFPERHMGLTPTEEHPQVEAAIGKTADVIKKYVDINSVIKIARSAPGLTPPSPPLGKGKTERGMKMKIPPRPPLLKGGHFNESPFGKGGNRGIFRPKIGVIKDSAFQFYYPENIEALIKRGARVIEFSALTKSVLPDIDALYIGGGFPETHAIALAENKSFRRSLKKAIEHGLPVYAECGGLMYLGHSLSLDNKEYPMTGIFPIKFTLHKKPQAHGYTIVKAVKKNPFYKIGTVLNGHEFHYSKAEFIDGENDPAFALKMKRGEGILNGMDGLCYKNVFATYTHIHALGSPQWAEGLIKAAGANGLL